jgi:hypothetical protein
MVFSKCQTKDDIKEYLHRRSETLVCSLTKCPKCVCMFHEPTGFGPNIYLHNIFWHSKVTVICILKGSNGVH